MSRREFARRSPARNAGSVTLETDDAFAEPLLTFADVQSLAAQIEAGLLAREARLGAGFADASAAELTLVEREGERARQRFIRANLRLVAMVARASGARANLTYADLFQEGCLGLITALERFDHRRGLRFSTYALFWIRAYVNAATAGHLGELHLPTKRAEQLRGARSLEAQLTQELGRTVSVAEVAEALGRTASWTADLLGHQPPQSLDLDDPALDRLGNVDELDAVLDAQFETTGLLARLDPLSRRVLELRLGLAGEEPQSIAQTARSAGISRTRVRRLELRALERLREFCPQQVWVHL